jgi:hypothetical protein
MRRGCKDMLVAKRAAAVRRPAVMLVSAIGVLGLGLGPAIALPAYDDDPPPTTACSPAPSARPPVEPSRPAAALQPSTHHVVLAAGASTTVRVRVVQPAQELDAFFLEDNGTKSEFTHCPFQGGLSWAASQLVRERNLRVGLGNFGDYQAFQAVPSGGTVGDLALAPGSEGVYFLDSPIRRPDHTFFADVVGLGSAWNAGWHATSGDQAALEAVYQAVTGTGNVIPPGLPDNIPAGSGAGFHADAFPVVVMVAGHWFNTSSRTPGYPGASFASATAALRAHGVRLAGVWLDNSKNKENSSGAKYDGFSDLRTLVEQSGTRTAAPLHCGGARPASPAGTLPLCVFTALSDAQYDGHLSAAPKQLGPVLRNLVDSLANPQPVSLSIGSGTAVVHHVVGSAHRGVNILLPHVFDATVALHCPASLAGHTIPVQLSELVAGQARASTAVTVTCKSKGKVPAAVAAAPALAIFGPSDPPGKAVVLSQAPPNPAPAPQVQPQPVPQQVAQGAGAVAFGEQTDNAMQLATVSTHQGDAEKVWSAALAMSALAGASLRWRSRSQPCYATVRVSNPH